MRQSVRRVRGGLVLGMLLGLAAPAFGQSLAPAQARFNEVRNVQPTRKADVKSESATILDRSISVNVRNMPLLEALQVVAKAGNVTLTYTSEVAKVRSKVTLDEKDIPLMRALTKLLAGTPLIARAVPPNEIVIASRDATMKDSASVSGRVVDTLTKSPISGVNVGIDGTNRRVVTKEDGTFAIRNITPGRYTLSFRRLGYASSQRTVTLEADQEFRVSVSMASVANSLTEVVTTGAGERQKLEVGNVISTVNADSIMKTTPVATMSQLLANRVPGVVALTGSGAVGSPTRLRVRGLSSIELDNGPMIIVDGIRISNASQTTQLNSIYSGVVGGAGTNDLSSRLDDLDPNSVESIEVLKGPSASTMYGSDAANGVIIIKTKRGRAGPTRWNFFADRHNQIQVKDYDYPVTQVGYALAGGYAPTVNCGLAQQLQGQCIPIPGDVVGFNQLADPRFTPQARGYSQSFGANVSGGVQQLQYYMGGTYLSQLGTAKLPNVTAEYVKAGRGGNDLPDAVLRPNARTDASANGRMTGTFFGNSDFSLGATFISQYQRVGNDGMSALSGTPRAPTDTTPITQGWETYYATRDNHIRHILGNAQTNWRPNWWGAAISGVTTYGWDYSLNDDQYYAPKGSCKPLCAQGSQDQGVLGYINAGRRSDFTQTLDGRATVAVPLSSWLRSTSNLGGRFEKRNWWDLYGNAANLRLGQRFYAANGAKNINDIGDARATAGWYYEQTFNAIERYYLNIGFRQDASSALGQDAKQPIYPKWNASWLVSQEPFFPWKDKVDIFRLRGAIGRAGVLPTTNARVRTYAVSGSFVTEQDTLSKTGGATGSYAQITGAGNPEIRPERSQEMEAGFDLDMFNSRFHLGYTHYDKSTHDAVEGGPVAGSVGADVTYYYKQNVGDVSNKGDELETSFRVLDGPLVSYSINANLTTRSNKLVKINPGVITFSSVSASGDLYTGNDSRIVPGYPLFGRWAYPILAYSDANGNGYIDPDEVRVGDSLVYVGPTEPKRTMYVGHTLGFLNNRLNINANFAYQSGQTQFNSDRKARALNLSAAQTSGSLEDQACVVASQANGARRATDWCFMETVKVLRWQDLSVNYQLQPSLARKVRAQSASLTFSATNLALWSNFHGRDPGLNNQPVNGNAVVAGSNFAAPREYGFRVSLGY